MEITQQVIKTKERSSNIELFRIITMFFIIAHHYVVNSGLLDLSGPIMQQQFCLKSLFYLVYGAWGKTGINCFVLITGYFMCKSNITVNKFCKLLFEIYFYRIIIYLIFFISKYEPFSIKTLLKAILPFTTIDKGFVGSYLVFYLLIPFINVLVQNLDIKKHRNLIFILVFLYSIFGSIPFLSINYNYVTWFCVLYIVASYIRFYPSPIFENTKLWGCITCFSIILSLGSVIILAYIGDKVYKFYAYSFMSDSNKIFALTTSISAFLLFKNLKIKYHRFINIIGSSCFGVFLIHANSDIMRRWLWTDLLKNTSFYDTDFYAIHAIVSVLGIFIVCTLIDLSRIYFIEKKIKFFTGEKNA